jgi:hypothetical protein
MSIQNVLEDLRLNRFGITDHAYLRMSQRGVIRRDIQSVGMTCLDWVLQNNGRFKVTGTDTEGDELSVVCTYDGDTLVVSLF